MATDKPNEIWVCVKTRACGWKRLEGERRDVPAKRQPGNGLRVIEQRCPRCNGRSFYVRQSPRAEAKDGQR